MKSEYGSDEQLAPVVNIHRDDIMALVDATSEQSANESLRIVADEFHPQTEANDTGERESIRASRLKRVGTAVLIAVLGAGTLLGMKEVIDTAYPDSKFSPEDTIVMIHEGDVLRNIAKQVDGVDGRNINNVIDEIEKRSPDLSDGVHPGDEAHVPTWVK